MGGRSLQETHQLAGCDPDEPELDTIRAWSLVGLERGWESEVMDSQALALSIGQCAW